VPCRRKQNILTPAARISSPSEARSYTLTKNRIFLFQRQKFLLTRPVGPTNVGHRADFGLRDVSVSAYSFALGAKVVCGTFHLQDTRSLWARRNLPRGRFQLAYTRSLLDCGMLAPCRGSTGFQEKRLLACFVSARESRTFSIFSPACRPRTFG